MKNSKLLRLQKKYKPERLMNLSGNKAILADRLYIPNKYISDEMLEEYTTKLGITDIERDEYGDDIEVEKEIKGYKEYKNCTAFQRGDLAKMDVVFATELADSKVKFLDIRSKPKMVNNIRFTGKLKKDQERVCREWIEYGYGILLAPPRYGKTILLCSILCKLHTRTLVIVHQHELIKQFKKALKKVTNSLNYKTGVSIVKRRNIDDLGTHDICIITWQLLNSKNGKKALRKYRNAFGLTIIDEVHKSPSPCYKEVVSKFNSYYRLGCTATSKRKDQMEPIVYDIVGPVTTKGKMNKVPVDVYIRKTEFDPGLKGYFMWHVLEKRLGSSASRNKLICKDIKKDMRKSPHNFGIVATRPVFHVKLLVKKLNRMGIKAAGFWGAAPYRERLLEDMVKGKYRVIVANRGMLLGINVPRWNYFYNTMPSSNKPSYYQEMSRVRTPYKKVNSKTGETWEKEKAVVRDYIDDFGPCYGCLQTRMKVYKKDKKIRIFYDGKEDVAPICGSCKYFNICILKGKSIKYNTHSCFKFEPRKKRMTHGK